MSGMMGFDCTELLSLVYQLNTTHRDLFQKLQTANSVLSDDYLFA